MLPFLSLMTPLSGSLAIRPRLAFAKSALSDHGSEAVEFLLNSGVDGDAGSPAVEQFAQRLCAELQIISPRPWPP